MTKSRENIADSQSAPARNFDAGNWTAAPNELFADLADPNVPEIGAREVIVYMDLALEQKHAESIERSIRDIVEATPYGYRSILAASKNLEARGYIAVERRNGNQANIYTAYLPPRPPHDSIASNGEFALSSVRHGNGHSAPTTTQGCIESNTEAHPEQHKSGSDLLLGKIEEDIEDKEYSLSAICNEFQGLWNSTSGVRQIRSMTQKRKRALSARLKDDDWRSLWRDGISAVARSGFCRGENDRGWRATADWFLRDDTLTKLLEGTYENGGSKNGRHKQGPGQVHPDDAASEW